MKRSRVFAGIFWIVLALGSFHVTTLSPSSLCWGAEGTGAATIEQISQHIKSKGVRMSEDKLNLVAQTVYEESLRYNVDYRLVLAVHESGKRLPPACRVTGRFPGNHAD